MWNILRLINRRTTDAFCVRIASHVLGANSFDRLLYLIFHKLKIIGREESAFFQKQLRPGMTVVDVGANIGLYTLRFSKLVGSNGRVYAFEPDPGLFSQAEANFRRNAIKNTIIFPMAAGADQEKKFLYQDAMNSGNNSLRRSALDEKSPELTVEVTTLDLILGKDRIDWMKIDVQGWEPAVFQGMSDLLYRNPDIKICFEFWPAGLKSAGFDPEEFLTSLHSQGFTLQPLTRNSNLSKTEIKSLVKNRRFIDIVAFR